MRAKFAQISYNEVSETRKKALEDYTKDMVSWRSLKEDSIHLLKRFLFLFIWVAFFAIYLEYCNAIVVKNACAFLGIEDVLGKTLLTAILLGLLALLSYRVIFFMAEHVPPRKTPIKDRIRRIRKFHDETEYLEDVTRIMDKLQKLSTEDLAYTDLIVDDCSIVLMIKDSEWGFIEKNKYTVNNEDIMKSLRETGILDFSSIDDEWRILKEKYQIV